MIAYRSYNNELLLKLLSADDQFAFKEIYDRYWQKLFVIAYNRLNEIETAEDLVHDVFTSLWDNRQKITIGCLENYLATAAKYLVLTRIKKLERERLYKNSINSAPVIDLPIEMSLHYKRILEIVKLEVEKLPEKCRLIFKYSREEKMSVREIAKQLDISPKTVENQLNKALKQLRIATKSVFSFIFLFF